jgi:nicotinamidase-related amidase
MWDVTTTDAIMPAAKAAIIICDMWDKHWSRGASERVDILAPTMNQVIAQARSVGVKIIHAPSETMHYYAHTPARLRMLEVPDCVMPPLIEHVDPPLPVDASDNGSDTGETDWYKAWSRQHPVIEIDQTQDGISDSGDEIYRFLQHHGIHQVFIMGVHTNMCILKRSFAIKAMVRRGVPVALVRDLTDAMYNPAMPPYVNHNEGTQLVIDYIEKFWCPTVSSADLANVDKVGK